MVTGLRPPQFGGVKNNPFAQANPAFRFQGSNATDMIAKRRREIEEDIRRREEERQAQHAAYMAESDGYWDKIYELREKMRLLMDQIRKETDPTQIQKHQDARSTAKWKINELFANSMFALSNAFSTALRL